MCEAEPFRGAGAGVVDVDQDDAARVDDVDVALELALEAAQDPKVRAAVRRAQQAREVAKHGESAVDAKPVGSYKLICPWCGKRSAGVNYCGDCGAALRVGAL